MKKLLFALSLALFCFSAKGQDRHFKKISFGFQLVKFHDEFGIGLHLLTPEFKNMRLNAKINHNWLNHHDAEGNEIWTGFLNNQVGIHFQRSINEKIGLYSEGGMSIFYPTQTLSDESVNLGGYGLFGFEFYFRESGKRNPSYFIELGGMGGGIANRLASKPIYANGFTIAVGYRF